MGSVSSKTSVVDLSVDRTIDSGSIRVDQVLISNNSGATVVVSAVNTAATKTYFTTTVPTGETFRLQQPFLADAGGFVLQSVSSANVIASVFHSQTGA